MASGSRVAFAGTAAAGVKFGRPHDVIKKTDDVNENLFDFFNLRSYRKMMFPMTNVLTMG